MREIRQYKGLYSTTDDGNIFSHRFNKVLKPWLIGNGYEMVMLYKDGEKPRKFLTHRLVALNYIPNPKSLREVNHKDGDIRNNKPDNIEWVTSKGNKAHAWKNGFYTHKGTNHYLAKLTDEKVREIRNLIKDGGCTQRYIAKTYGVSNMTISLIGSGKIWKHVI